MLERSSVCHISLHGEGASPLSALSLDFGGIRPEQRQVSFALADLPPGAVVSATATDPEGNTSEFSRCVSVQPQQIFANGFE